MRKNLTFIIASLCLLLNTKAQTPTDTICGQPSLHKSLLDRNSFAKSNHALLEQSWAAYRKQPSATRTTAGVVTLPVVVHIIHEDGDENISDDEVRQGIDYLNKAFANIAPYDPSSGVDTKIQFCLAKRDPNGQNTTGITRNKSSLTSVNINTTDQAMKNLNRWDPSCYINIWLVKQICNSNGCGGVAGYAYLPSAHGLQMDGIVVRSDLFGSAPGPAGTSIHEMGHYLGLYHTFEEACKNDDCDIDGDKICDTPPDGLNSASSCSVTTNSCNTDTKSGFATDQNDIRDDYMDYGNNNCRSVFTAGQAERMNWVIQVIRKSLLNCQSCLDPCPVAINASFTPGSSTIAVGSTINFVNTSTNADVFEWYVDDVLVAATKTFDYTFLKNSSRYTIKLVAKNSSNTNCVRQYIQYFETTCATTVDFLPNDSSLHIGSTLNFINNSAKADKYQWYVNDVLKSTAKDFNFTFNEAGTYVVTLKAINTADSSCNRILKRWYTVQCLTSAGFNESPLGYNRVSGAVTTFINTSLLAGSYEWYANDVLVGTTKDLSYTFPNTGLVVIKLIAKNASNPNCVAEYSNAFLISCPIIADFTPLGGVYAVGTTLNFTNASSNATSYEWYVDNVLVSTSTNFSFTFNTTGVHRVRLVAKNTNTNCSSEKVSVIGVDCSTAANFTPLNKSVEIGTTLTLTNTSANANGYKWFVDGVLQPTSLNLTYTFNEQRNHLVTLVATNSAQPGCPDTVTGIIHGECYDAANFTTEGIPALGNKMHFTNKSVGASTYAWYVNGVLKSTERDFDLPFNATGKYEVKLTITGKCSRSKTTRYEIFLPNLPDSCFKFTYRMDYFDSTQNAPTDVNSALFPKGEDIVTTDDGGVLISAYTSRAAGPGRNYSGPYLMKLGRRGNVEWQKVFYNVPTNRSFLDINHKLAKLKNGDVVSVFPDMAEFPLNGWERSNTDAFVVRHTQKVDFVWQRRIQIKDTSNPTVGNSTCSYEKVRVKDVIANENDHLTIALEKVSSSICGGAVPILYLLRLNGDGNPIWADTINTGQRVKNIIGLAERNDTLFVFCTSSGTNFNSFMIRYKASTGQLLSTVRYGSNDYATKVIFEKPFFVENKLFVSGRIGYGVNGDMRAVRFELDPASEKISQILHVYGTTCNAGAIVEYAADGKTGFLGCSSASIFFKLDDNNNVLWAASNGGFQNAIEKQEIRLLADSGILFWNGYNGRMDRMTKDGKFYTCAQTTRALLVQTLAPFSGTSHTVVKTSFGIASLPVNIYTKDSLFNRIRKPCSDSIADCKIDTCDRNLCKTVKIQGPATVCSFTDPVTFTLLRDSTCTAKTTWRFDGTMAKLIEETDSTLKLKFTKDGLFKLYADINSCSILTDSVRIDLHSSPPKIDLGQDKAICTANTFTLKAGNGFKSYTWQDGSSDSSFTAFEPGKYFVVAEDYCGVKYSDTIDIRLSTLVPFDVGGPVTVCENDSVKIKAPASFSNYSWAPTYNIDYSDRPDITIWPTKDTTYSVVAQTSSGCLVLDTIRVHVNKREPFHISNDTTLCETYMGFFNVPPGFTDYVWQDGSTFPNYVIGVAGTYWVQAKDKNGCAVADTFKVLQVFSVTKPALGNNLAICKGTTAIFDAGNNYVSYVWQDGSTNKIFNANTPGKYWVTVSDFNKCVSSDSVEITGFKSTPEDFLDPFAEICPNKTIQLKAKGIWDSYLWDNNAKTPVINIDQPGQYWLQVTNTEGCTGKDTIIVSTKDDCLKGVYFPSAFTPDNNGKNDYFKPIVNEPTEQYRLVVFNRWGQRVFETSDVNKGWDGTYGGKRQDSGAFTWYCTYKFAGTNPVTQKGLLMLIR